MKHQEIAHKRVHGKTTIVYLKMVFLAVGMLVFLASCETLVNDIDPSRLPNGETKLVVQGFISPQDTLISVRVSATTPVFGKVELNPDSQPAVTPEIMKGIQVMLSEGSQRVSLTLNTKTGNYEIKAAKFPIIVGRTYQLYITNTRGDIFESSCTVPNNVPITNYKLEKAVAVNNNAQDSLLQFYWQDPVKEANFYRIGGFAREVYKEMASPGKPAVETTQVTPLRLESSGRRGEKFLTDAQQDGLQLASGTSRIMGSFFQKTTSLHKIQIEYYLISSDKNYYEYHQIVRNFDDDNPFVEPTLIPTNIKNGLGCFAAYNRSSLILQ